MHWLISTQLYNFFSLDFSFAAKMNLAQGNNSGATYCGMNIQTIRLEQIHRILNSFKQVLLNLTVRCVCLIFGSQNVLRQMKTKSTLLIRMKK